MLINDQWAVWTQDIKENSPKKIPNSKNQNMEKLTIRFDERKAMVRSIVVVVVSINIS